VTQDIAVTVTDLVEEDPAAVNVFLVNTKTDEVIGSLSNGDVFQFADLEGQKLSIFADVDPSSDLAGQVGSVSLDFEAGEITKIENFAPYALFGDNGKGNFFGGVELDTGEYELALELFSGKAGKGNVLETVNLNFSIVDQLSDESNANALLIEQDVFIL